MIKGVTDGHIEGNVLDQVHMRRVEQGVASVVETFSRYYSDHDLLTVFLSVMASPTVAVGCEEREEENADRFYQHGMSSADLSQLRDEILDDLDETPDDTGDPEDIAAYNAFLDNAIYLLQYEL